MARMPSCIGCCGHRGSAAEYEQRSGTGGAGRRRVLGSYARPETLTALRRAATSGQALALLLMSPEFQRR